MRIVALIATDTAVIEAVRAALDHDDFVLVEHSPEPALRRFLSVQPDAVVVDDGAGLGVEAIRRIRDAGVGAPVVALSARGDTETQARFAIEGTRGFLTKPFSCDQLIALVDAVSVSVTSAAPPPMSTEAKSTAPAARPGQPMDAYPALQSGAPGRDPLPQHRTALRWLSRTAGYMRDPDRLSLSLVEMLLDTFDTHRAAVLLEEHGRVRLAASHGLPEDVAAGLGASFASALLGCFEQNPGLLDRTAISETAGPSGALLQATRKEMQLLGMRMAAPLMCGGRVSGAVLTGDKASGQDYSFEERDLLSGLARSASMTLENAGLYQRAARQEQHLQTLLASIPLGVIVVGADQRISLMNRTAARTLQVPEGELLGQSLQRLGSAFADVLLRTQEAGKPLMRQEISDAAINATLSVSATPLDDTDTQPAGVVAVFSVLPVSGQPEEDVSYSPFWEYLASRVAQEIKNPMVAINTFAQLLPRKYELEEFREQFGEVVQSEVTRINNVVETLFEFARRPRLEPQPAALNEAVTKSMETYANELATRNITLNTHYAEGLPEASLDPIFFSQALHNVVQNAIDAMATGGALTIATRTSDAGNGPMMCEVLVTDTGSGISEEDAGQVFMPFFSTKEKGMGLGLTLAYRIMHQHGGDLRLVPGATEGASFVLRLPLATAPTPPPRPRQQYAGSNHG